MSALSSTWHELIAWLAGDIVTPFLTWAHMLGAGDPRAIATALLLALLQIAIIAFVLRPLESLVPAERWSDRRLTRIDLQYTLLMLLGLSPLFSYLLLAALGNIFFAGATEAAGVPQFALEHVLPWFQQHPYWLFFVYYICYDLTYYWMHRAQHAIPWWWALHSMHHSQRQMSCWTNDRGNYLDAVLQSIVLASVALVIGIDVDEFALLMLLSELVQNLSHTNVRIGFGAVLEKCFVDPKFHRLHHMRSDPARPDLHNCNFGQVLSVWDVLFGTALYGEALRPTGVCDPVIDADNERGLIAQQWGSMKRFWGAFKRPAGWRFSDVAFGPDYVPIPSHQRIAHTLQGTDLEAPDKARSPV